MGKPAQLKLAHIKNGLVNLPLSLHAALASKDVAPQSLVVQLSAAGMDNKVFVGWSGMPSNTLPHPATATSQSVSEILEMDRSFASELSLSEGATTTVELLLRCPTVKAVHITPQTPDDWEVLELHADAVEATLLSQIRAVTHGQPLCTWVGERSANTHMLRFMVDEVELLSGGKLETGHPARLDRDSEVIIAPKLRQIKKVEKAQLVPVSDKTKATDFFDYTLFRLLPHELLQTVQVTDTVVFHPSHENLLDLAFPSASLRLSHYPRPKNASSKSRRRASSVEKDQDQLKKSSPTQWSTSWNVPPFHIWVPPNLRHQLHLFSSEWNVQSEYCMIKLFQIEGAQNEEQKSREEVKEILTAEERERLGSTPSGGKMARQFDTPQVLVAAESHLESINMVLRRSLSSWRPGRQASGLLLAGSSGSGKTALVKRIAQDATQDRDLLAYVQYIDCAKYTDERPASLKQLFKDWFDEACWRAPSVIVLDNIEAMLPAEVEHIDTFRASLFAHLFLDAAREACASRPIFVLATSSHSEAAHLTLQSSHLLDVRHHLKAPHKEARKALLAHYVDIKTKGSSTLHTSELDYSTLAGDTEGYLPIDLRELVNQTLQFAVVQRSNNHTVGLTMDCFANAIRDFKPLSLRDVKLQKSNVNWSDIGGLHEVRQVLRETLEFPTKYAAIFANCPLRLRSGLLLYGYPGCGKTLLASAVAQECGLNFISVKGPELLNKYIGSSERSVRELFERAQSAKPCVLFFDEFDSIAPRRGHDSTGVTDRVVNQMLTQMDGAEGLDGVYVLAATSRPDLIDPALLRPGRLDKSLLCDMPTENERKDILEACCRKLELEEEVDLSYLANKTPNFSGADLQALVYNAHLDAVHEVLESRKAFDQDSEEEGLGSAVDMVTSAVANVASAATQSAINQRLSTILKNSAQRERQSIEGAPMLPRDASERAKPCVTEEHLEKALGAARPSVPMNEVARLRRIYGDFVSGRSSGGLPDGEASDQIGGRVTLG